MNDNSLMPPVYRVDKLFIGGGVGEITPRFPVVILPSTSSDIALKFWGSENYDVHIAFGRVDSRIVLSITYTILLIDGLIGFDTKTVKVVGDTTHMRFFHSFLDHPILGLHGLHGRVPMMKPYRRLVDLPALPHDWCYYQFVS